MPTTLTAKTSSNAASGVASRGVSGPCAAAQATSASIRP